MDSENDPCGGLSSDGIASSTVDFHESSGIYHTQFDVHTRSASEAILTAVATAIGKDQLELPPLYSAIDPDALDALFDTPTHSASKQCLTVSFEYAGCQVSAKARGTVVVEPNCEDEQAER